MPYCIPLTEFYSNLFSHRQGKIRQDSMATKIPSQGKTFIKLLRYLLILADNSHLTCKMAAKSVDKSVEGRLANTFNICFP